jgi:hypothetical protein
MPDLTIAENASFCHCRLPNFVTNPPVLLTSQGDQSGQTTSLKPINTNKLAISGPTPDDRASGIYFAN